MITLKNSQSMQNGTKNSLHHFDVRFSTMSSVTSFSFESFQSDMYHFYYRMDGRSTCGVLHTLSSAIFFRREHKSMREKMYTTGFVTHCIIENHNFTIYEFKMNTLAQRVAKYFF